MKSVAIIPLLSVLPVAGYAQSERPNILLIIADDMRPALGCYGYPQVISPNIDALGARGTIFRQAYCNVPVSGASRASLLTGIYPDTPERFYKFDAWAEREVPDAIPLPEWFKQHGYTTLSIGKVFHNIDDCSDTWSEYPWRLHPEGYGKDWAEYNKWELWLNDASAEYVNKSTRRGPFCEAADVADSLYDDGQITMHAIKSLRRLKNDANPFLLAVGFWRPHLPFNAPQKYWDLYERDSIATADNRFRPKDLPKQVTGSSEIKGYGNVGNLKDGEFHRLARHGYYACVSFIDAQIGAILNELSALGMKDNTVVIFLGDHGWHLGEHNFWGKHNLMHCATNAPLIIAAPKSKPIKTNAIAQFVDIYPTLCDYANIPTPPQTQGCSLKPVVDNRKRSVNRYAFVQWNNGIDIIDDRYSYGLWLNESGDIVAEMLFDHKNDPNENTNVVNDKTYGNVVANMQKAILNFKKKLKTENLQR